MLSKACSPSYISIYIEPKARPSNTVFDSSSSSPFKYKFVVMSLSKHQLILYEVPVS
jgi:hypothetical protein